ncbi:28285_t:CDS:1 [Racocetra persica]|uniref:28285_t:CDS:1 n=1 Tax=Racocetra persica TaxID=160502 RepID=A0ACA9NK68_9GLOM|nr:28285_t:CDS:1 [Racocetra persica]
MVYRLPPEVLQKIFCNINDCDLYPCVLLVNRQWCANAVSLIWRETLNKPMGIPSYYKLIQIYVSCMPDGSKTLLKNAGIGPTTALSSTVTLFNYASFLRKIELTSIYEAATLWVSANSGSNSRLKRLGRFDLDSLDNINENDPEIQKYEQMQELFYRELLKLFVSLCPNLRYSIIIRNVIWKGELQYLHNISDIIPTSSYLDKLGCYTSCPSDIFEYLGSTFSSLDQLDIDCRYDDNDGLASFIDKIDSLQSLTIKRTDNRIPKIIKALRDKVKSLSCLHIMNGGLFPLDMFAHCQNLKSLKITEEPDRIWRDLRREFEEFEENFLEPFIKPSVFKQLTIIQIEIDDTINIFQLATIIRNTNGRLLELLLKWIEEDDSDNENLLYLTIIEHCPRLTKLKIPTTGETVKHLPSIFRSCTHLEKVEMLGLESKIEISELMPFLGQTISSKLNSLHFDSCFRVTTDSLNIFLELCYQRSISFLDLVFQQAEDWFSCEQTHLINHHMGLGTLNVTSNMCWFNEIEYHDIFGVLPY